MAPSDSDSDSDTEDAGIMPTKPVDLKRDAEAPAVDERETKRPRGLADVGRIKVARQAPPVASDSGLTAEAVSELSESVRLEAEEEAIALEAAATVVRRKRESKQEESRRLAREEREAYEAAIREDLDSKRRSYDFILHLEDSTMLLHILSVIVPLVQDSIFDVNGECLSMTGMDSSQVSFLSMRLDKSEFMYFYAARVSSFGIHIASLVDILKIKINKASEVQIMKRTGSDRLEVNFLSDGKYAAWEVATLDIDQESRIIPDFASDVSAVMNPVLFTDMIKAFSVAGEGVTFEFFPDMMQLKSKERGADVYCTTSIQVKEGSFVYMDDELNPHRVACGKKLVTNLALRYLKYFAKAQSFSDALILKQSHQGGEVGPMIFEYPTSASRVSFVRFMIAPRISDE